MAIEITGRINEAGKLEFDLPGGLPSGTVFHITVEPIDTDPAWFWASSGQEAQPKVDNTAEDDINTTPVGGGVLEDVDSMDEP